MVSVYSVSKTLDIFINTSLICINNYIGGGNLFYPSIFFIIKFNKMNVVRLPYKVHCKNLEDIKNTFPHYKDICKVGGNFNMLFLKKNEFAAVCEDGNFYIITY